MLYNANIMNAQECQELKDIFEKKFGLTITQHYNMKNHACASISWAGSSGFNGDDLVLEKGTGFLVKVLDTSGDTEEDAVFNMAKWVSGKTLFQHKSYRKKKQVKIPSFSSLAELKLKVLIATGDLGE